MGNFAEVLEHRGMSGEPVKAECLPFSQIPHATPLFIDYLSHHPKIQQFLPRSPRFADWFQDETQRIKYDSMRREKVADVLARQNRSWGASSLTEKNIARLRSGACAVVTGQQVGLFGGPVFSIYKALTAVKLAEQATAGGVDCVPIFWLATEDHDLAEVNHVSIPGPDFSLQRLSTPTQGVREAPVGSINFGDEINLIVESSAGLLGSAELADLLRDTYRQGESFGSAFARLFTRLFADWGVILLDSSDPELHAISQPIYRSALERAAELDEALLARGKALELAGYHQQVKVTPSSTLLFAFRDGARLSVHRRINGNSGGEFVIGEEKVSRDEIMHLVASAPHEFSANVLLRPVVQDYLLPTLAYVGGAAEVAYFAQAAVVYEALVGRITPILPRFSATIIEQKPGELLERYRLALSDLFRGPEELREELASRSLPGEVQKAFERGELAIQKSLADITESLRRLDVTLVDAATRTGSKMRYQLDRLRRRAARAELLREEILARHATLLSNALYPDKILQERSVAGIYYVARYGADLLHRLYSTIDPACLDHQVVYLDSLAAR